MVRKDECSVLTIVVVVVHVSMLRRVLIEISMVRRDLCQFRDSSLAEHCLPHPFVSGDAPRFFLLRLSKSCQQIDFHFEAVCMKPPVSHTAAALVPTFCSLNGTFGALLARQNTMFAGGICLDDRRCQQNLEKDHSISAHGGCYLQSHHRQWVG